MEDVRHGQRAVVSMARAFEHLAQEALGSEKSRELILRIVRDLWALPAGLESSSIPARLALDENGKGIDER
jgi:hypothetical protein